MTTIKLSNEVRVSDPCYDDDVWCKSKIKDVLPGEYVVQTRKKGGRVAWLMVTHKDHLKSDEPWIEHSTIGVDSGQAGIFCESSYRNDEITIEKPKGSDFALNAYHESGDRWYEKMCSFTLSDKQWGSYESGVASSSGWGDGMYPVDVKKHKGKIICIKVLFI